MIARHQINIVPKIPLLDRRDGGTPESTFHYITRRRTNTAAAKKTAAKVIKMKIGSSIATTSPVLGKRKFVGPFTILTNTKASPINAAIAAVIDNKMNSQRIIEC